ncbi:diacylglycerol/lipid kinase family protein [Nocardia sp. NPDC052566]|uniref:diacylglycerol/lipid kinase family protein n=1 Tax=Nocardia sp. NPDC052566 TaxID=3364330 RepID=UPI0037C5835C
MVDGDVSALVIVNPTAGGDPSGIVETLSNRKGLALRVVQPSSAADAERVARDIDGGDRPDVVIAVGGDGTAGRVCAGLARAGVRVPLLVAPGGTGNSSYRGLCDDRPWPEIVAALADRRLARCAIDLAAIEELDRTVLLGTTTGLLPATLAIARELPGSGRDLLSAATMAALDSHKPYPVRVFVDEVLTYEDHLLGTYIGGMRHRGGRFEMLPESLLDDGLLDICLLTGNSAPQYARGRTIRVERTDGEPLRIEYDGELDSLGGSYTVSVLPAALSALVPTPLPAGIQGSELLTT